MRFVLYTHSLVSDWNHGNAHFLRGILRELQARGHDTLSLEPEDGWSRNNLVAAHGVAALEGFHQRFSRVDRPYLRRRISIIPRQSAMRMSCLCTNGPIRS